MYKICSELLMCRSSDKITLEHYWLFLLTEKQASDEYHNMSENQKTYDYFIHQAQEGCLSHCEFQEKPYLTSCNSTFPSI